MSEHSHEVSGSRHYLVAAPRMLLLIVAALSLAAALILADGRGRGTDPARRYVCPMHAEVTARGPADCPICGMKLEPLERSEAPPLNASSYETYDIMRRRAYGPAVPSPAWVDDDGVVTAILYTDELAYRSVDETAVFIPSDRPGSATTLRALPGPPLPWDRSTRRVRYRREADAPALRPGYPGWLRRAARSPEPPVLPYSAVIEGRDGPYVLATTNGRTLRPRAVEVGRVFGGAVAVLSGLQPEERALTGSVFFVDAERRLEDTDTIDVVHK